MYLVKKCETPSIVSEKGTTSKASSPRVDLDISGEICMVPGIAQVVGWEPRDLQGLAHVSGVGPVLYRCRS